MNMRRSVTAPPAVPTPTTAPHPRARPIPRKVRDAIEAMQSGKAKNLAQAAKCVGVSRQYLSQTLSKRPDVVVWATNRMARILGIGASVAGAQMLELTHSSSSRVSFEASRHVLALAGIAPANQPQVSVNVSVRAGWVIDLSENHQPEQKIVGGQVIDAKPIAAKAD